MTAFIGAPVTAVKAFCGNAVSVRPRSRANASVRTPTAEIKLVPGVPPGEDARDNAPMRYYVPRPVETYDDRGFSTKLQKTWAGEVNTIGAGDIEPLTNEMVKESKLVPEDAESSGAFVEFAQMMKADREAALARQAARRDIAQPGRPTCGPNEGKDLVSNYVEILVDGVKAVEYWGVPNGNVPRLFGGPGE